MKKIIGHFFAIALATSPVTLLVGGLVVFFYSPSVFSQIRVADSPVEMAAGQSIVVDFSDDAHSDDALQVKLLPPSEGVEIVERENNQYEITVSSTTLLQTFSIKYRFRDAETEAPLTDPRVLVINISGTAPDTPEDIRLETETGSSLTAAVLSEEEIGSGTTVEVVATFTAGSGSLDSQGLLNFNAPEQDGDVVLVYVLKNSRGEKSAPGRILIDVRKPSLNCDAIDGFRDQNFLAVRKKEYVVTHDLTRREKLVLSPDERIRIQRDFCFLDSETTYKSFMGFVASLPNGAIKERLEENVMKLKRAAMKMSLEDALDYVKWLNDQYPKYEISIPTLEDYKAALILSDGLIKENILAGLSEWTSTKCADDSAHYHTIGLNRRFSLETNRKLVGCVPKAPPKKYLGFRVKLEGKEE